MPVAPHALPAPTPPQLGCCQCGPLAWRTLLISHTMAHMQSEITFSLSPGISQQGITQASGRTGNLTIALRDTHQVFKTMKSFHNFSKAAGEEKKIPSHVLKGSVSLGRDRNVVRDVDFLVVNFLKYLSSTRKASFVKK